MKNCVKTELKKAFQNPMFYLALGIAMLLVLWDVYTVGMEVQRMTEFTIRRVAEGRDPGGSEGYCLWMMTIPYNGFSFPGRYYNLIWPLLAALPFGWSYMSERRSGLYNQIASRCGAKRYYVSKYIAVFVSGGAAVSFPILMDLLLCALVCPYGVLDPAGLGSPITSGYFLSRLFYTQPWLFGLIWCGMEFLWGGAAACLCFLLGARVRLAVLITVFPFALLMLWANVAVYLYSLPGWFLALSPLSLFSPAPLSANPGWLLFSLIGALTCLSFGVGYWQVVKHELG